MGLTAVIGGSGKVGRLIATPYHPRPGERERAAVHAAAAAGVRHVVKVSSYAAGLEPEAARRPWMLTARPGPTGRVRRPQGYRACRHLPTGWCRAGTP
jgi:hypothetical protein